MKLRRVILTFVLALLIACVAVLPVAADRSVTPVAFTAPGYTMELIWPILFSGPVVHFHGEAEALIVSDNPLLNGATISQEEIGPSHVVQGEYWCPAIAWFTITLAGDPESGWRGTAHALPQVGDKWPRPRFQMRLQGEGFGTMKNTRIDLYRDFYPGEWSFENAYYTGQIEGL
ncbi:MAG: hypothetical protein ACYC6L_04610 [Anaerolineae bacterium]